MPQLVNKKTYICSDFVEVFDYEKPFWVGFPRLRSSRSSKKKVFVRPRVRSDNTRRSMTSVRRLVDSNPQLDKFILLTFNTPILTLSEANFHFKLWVLRVSSLFSSFQYFSVPEFQPVSGRVHYHVLCNIPWVSLPDLESIWGHGFVGISYVRDRERIGYYISKYLAKSYSDIRYFGKRKYLYSKSLNRPICFYNSDYPFSDFSFFRLPPIVLRQGSFFSDYLGEIKYSRIKWQKIKILGP